MSDYDPKKQWTGVDLDGTLAYYDKWIEGAPIGEPIPAMLQRVKDWLAEGKRVKIFTARVADARLGCGAEKEKIVEWCLKHVGCILPITATKDMYMVECWDDRGIQVIKNKGLNAAEEAKIKLAAAEDEIARLRIELSEAREGPVCSCCGEYKPGHATGGGDICTCR